LTAVSPGPSKSHVHPALWAIGGAAAAVTVCAAAIGLVAARFVAPEPSVPRPAPVLVHEPMHGPVPPTMDLSGTPPPPVPVRPPGTVPASADSPIAPSGTAAGALPPGSGAASPQDLIARVKPAVILVAAAQGGGGSSGTGFVVAPGVVATCGHIVAGVKTVTLVTNYGSQVGGYVGSVDTLNDVALIYSAGAGLPPPIPLGNSDAVREGDEIAVTGYPLLIGMMELGFRPVASTSRGTISARRVRVMPEGPVQLLQIDAPTNPGNSGCPVYSTRDGCVLGLVSTTLSSTQGISFAVPVNVVRRLLGRQ
jgi:serine protease Do